MRKPRLVVLTATPLALALALSACGSSDSGTSPSNAPNAGSGNTNGAISIYGTEPETNMLPANATDAGSAKMQEAIYSKLVGFKPEDGATYNEVAESIESPDSKVWTIKLKKGFKFHDGTEVKAKNFVDAWNWGANSKNAQLAASFFEDIAGYKDVHTEDPDEDGPQKAPEPATDKMSGLKVVDDLTFEVTLNGPFSVFPSKIGYTPFSPLPDVFFKDPEAFAKAPIGNGPLKFVSRTPNTDIKLTRFDDYSGTKKVNFKDLTIKIYSTQEAAYKDLLSDNLDFMEALPPSAKAGGKYEKDLGDQVLKANLLSVSTLAVPDYVPAYKNPDVRKAISMAINREQITKTVLQGTYVPADGLVPEGIEGYEKDTCGEACHYDPAKAKALWDTVKGSFPGKITIMSNADGGRKEPLEAACNSIKNALGTDCEFLPATNFGQYRQVVNGRQLTGLGRSDWSADYPSIENFLVPIVKTGGSSNDGKYSNPAVDKLLEQAGTTADKAASIKLYQEASKLAIKDLPKIPTWVEKGIGARSKKLSAVQLNFKRQIEYSSVVVK
jgi:oligopeptide transport system substrate-binding protein